MWFGIVWFGGSGLGGGTEERWDLELCVCGLEVFCLGVCGLGCVVWREGCFGGCVVWNCVVWREWFGRRDGGEMELGIVCVWFGSVLFGSMWFGVCGLEGGVFWGVWFGVCGSEVCGSEVCGLGVCGSGVCSLDVCVIWGVCG